METASAITTGTVAAVHIHPAVAGWPARTAAPPNARPSKAIRIRERLAKRSLIMDAAQKRSSERRAEDARRILRPVNIADVMLQPSWISVTTTANRWSTIRTASA